MAREVETDSEGLGFVDQHDGNAVLNRKDKAAGVANQSFGRGAVFQLSLTLGTNQNLEELWGKAHVDSLGVAGKPNRVRAPEFFRQFGNVLTQQSRYTGAPISSSSLPRAWAPMALIVVPERPITIAFCDSRS